MNELEQLAAKALLNEGISLPLRTTGGKERRVTMRVPTLRDLIRISEMYVRLDVKYEDLKRMSVEEKAEFVARKGKAVSRMVAFGIVRLPLLNGVASRIVGWWLRRNMHHVALEEAWMKLLALLQTGPFDRIIASAEATNRLASHKKGNRS